MILVGTVVRSVGGIFTVMLDEEYNGKNYIEIRAKGAFKHDRG